MKIGFTDIKDVFVTLPIGYYAMERIPVVLEQHGHGTYYSPVENKIFIDAEQIEKLCGNVPDDVNPETFIRSCLYHEVSHALLTPKYPTFPFILNVFEDERIERLMDNYYEGVDFFQNIVALNGWDGTCDKVPESTTQAFYDIVRYHVAPPNNQGQCPTHLVDKVNTIIESYKKLSANNAPEDYFAKAYVCTIRSFFDEVKMFYPDLPTETPPSQSKRNNQTSENKDNGSQNSSENADDNDSSNNSGDTNQSGASGGQAIGDKDEDYIPNKAEQGNAEKKECQKGDVVTNMGGNGNDDGHGTRQRGKKVMPRGQQTIESAIAEMRGVIPNPNMRLIQGFERIFTSFNKRNNSGSAMQSYSGKLNPRNCTRNDYRYWDKKAVVNGANKYGTAHLNLFIDVSGSMCDSICYVNEMLDALYKTTKNHKEITYSILAIREGQRRVNTKYEPFLQSGGGTDITDAIFGQYRDMQKKNTAVYNLVILDGAAYHYGGEQNFGAFNHHNCTIISDSQNEIPIRTYAPNAKTIITDDYANDFVNAVIKTLEIAFR